jgi:hypothetical protein
MSGHTLIIHHTYNDNTLTQSVILHHTIKQYQTVSIIVPLFSALETRNLLNTEAEQLRTVMICRQQK